MSETIDVIGDNAAEALVGNILPGGWKVVTKLDRVPEDTGGTFSVHYIVERAKERGFCKVLNYYWILASQPSGVDPVDIMAYATRLYQFERDLARDCAKLSRVVTAIDDGTVRVPGFKHDIVSYIIFEIADRDIRKFLNTSDRIDIAARLRCVHNVATGLRQLHGVGIAHQDVKPSNTLVFAANEAGHRITKIADLGRATAHGRPMDHDRYPIAGDPAYAPPEALYGSIGEGFGPRRLACDLYQLGGMIAFVFTTANVTALLKMELHPSHLWTNWAGSYDEVLPYVRDAFGRVVRRIMDAAPEEIQDRIGRLVAQLCDPDPLARGHTKTIGFPGSNYALDRIVTELNLLSVRAEVAARRSA